MCSAATGPFPRSSGGGRRPDGESLRFRRRKNHSRRVDGGPRRPSESLRFGPPPFFFFVLRGEREALPPPGAWVQLESVAVCRCLLLPVAACCGLLRSVVVCCFLLLCFERSCSLALGPRLTSLGTSLPCFMACAIPHRDDHRLNRCYSAARRLVKQSMAVSGSFRRSQAR